MDNLQRFYLLQLAAAKERALAGDSCSCLQTCFELRLKPDIALYTRALVCLTICDLSTLQGNPEKLNLAVEALRLATELKEDSNPQEGSFWSAEYDQLEADTEGAVEQAQLEVREHVDRLMGRANRASIEDRSLEVEEGERSSASTVESRSSQEKKDEEAESENEEEHQLEGDWYSDTEVVGMPPIEVQLAVLARNRAIDSRVRDDTDDEIDHDGEAKDTNAKDVMTGSSLTPKST